MRLFALLLLLVAIAIGVMIGALNAEPVVYDLAFTHIHWPKGAALLAALLLGWLLGGLTAWLGASFDRRCARRRARKANSSPPA